MLLIGNMECDAIADKLILTKNSTHRIRNNPHDTCKKETLELFQNFMYMDSDNQ